jgi:FtsH-binding integral membrane protein
MSNFNAIDASISNSPTRTNFIRKVYGLLFLSILAFVGLEVLWFSTDVAHVVFNFVSSTNWLVVIGALMLTSWLSTRMAQPGQSQALQFGGLLFYVVMQSLVFIPLLIIAEYYGGSGVIAKAALMTGVGFTALTGVVFFTKVDLAGMGKYLAWAGIVALGTIVASVIFGFELGTFFSLAMVTFAGFAILHDTSKILHTHDDDSSAAAALQLFASVALMFWYLLRLFSDRK